MGPAISEPSWNPSARFAGSTHHLTSISRDSGLPSNQVHAITQDGSGRLWLAGPMGLTRYDGTTLRVFDQRNGLICQGLRTVHAGDAGDIWVGTDQGLERLSQEGERLPVLEGAGWAHGLVERIASRGPEIWIGGPFGLARLESRGGRAARVTALAQDVGFVRDLLPRACGNLLFASSLHGLVLHDGNGWRKVHPAGLPEGAGVLCLEEGPGGMVLVGTTDGLWALDETLETLGQFRPNRHRPSVKAIAVCGEERWLACAGSLYVAQPQGTGSLVLRQVADLGRINDLYADALGNIWIATNNAGLKKISCLRNAIAREETGHEGAVYSIQPGPGGRIRIGGEGFSAHLSDAGTPPRLIQGLPPETVWDTADDPADSRVAWFATQEGLFRQAPDGTTSRFGQDHPVLASPCRTLLAHQGGLWVGTLSGLACIRNGTIEEVAAPDGRPFGYVYTLSTDPAGRLWIGTLGRGLFRDDGEGPRHQAAGALTEGGNIYAIAHAPMGKATLLLQDEKVLLWEAGGQPRLLASEYPVAGWTALWLDERTAAIGSSDGLKILDTVTGAVIRRINPLFGEDAWEFTHNRSLATAPDGTLLCGVNGGLLAVSLPRMSAYEVPPGIHLDRLEWSGAAPTLDPKGGYRVPAGRWSLVVHAFSAWLVEERQIAFQFKFSGFDRDWTPLSKSPQIRYSALPPGHYELFGRAYSPLSGYGEPQVLCRVVVKSPWWTWGWAPLLGAVSTSFDHFVLSRNRHRILTERARNLEQEVARRTDAMGRLLRETERLKELAERGTRAKSAFLATMSHELRTPLNSIIGFTGMLEQELPGPLNPEQKNQLGMVRTSARHLLHLINDVLDISKIEAGELRLAQEPFDLGTSVGRVVGIITPLAQRKGLAMRVDGAGDAGTLIGDQRRVEQILLNLLTNAIKFTSSGTVGLSVEHIADCHALPSAAPRPAIRLSVADTGIGISKEHLDDLFQPFRQVDSTLTRQYEGTGLGLAICQQLTWLMGGRIGVQSRLGEGSVFSITLPRDGHGATQRAGTAR